MTYDSAKYYQEHKERIRENQRKYRKEHKEEIRICQKEYHQKNKEKLVAYQKEYKEKTIKDKSNCVDCGKPIYKISIRCRDCLFIRMKGPDNPAWAGDNVCYATLHQWIKRRKPKPERCSKCGEQGFLDLANVSGEYKRDVNDFDWICRKCHMESDGRMDYVKKYPGMGMSVYGWMTQRNMKVGKRLIN